MGTIQLAEVRDVAVGQFISVAHLPASMFDRQGIQHCKLRSSKGSLILLVFLHVGTCQKHDIALGKPTDCRAYRERPFLGWR